LGDNDDDDDDNDNDDDDCGDDGFAGGDVSEDAMAMLIKMMMTVKAKVLIIRWRW
jgi:hypothetical protein